MANEVELSADDVHNPPSSDPTDQTPLVNTTQIDQSDVPEYERQAAQDVALAKGNDPSDVANVDSSPLASRKITVDDSTAYSAADQAHELQHVVQNDNTPIVQKLKNQLDPIHASIAGVSSGATGSNTTYDYGGTEGLAKHFASGKGVSDLNAEQQASIPQNYMKEYTRLTNAKDTKGLDRLNEVYDPAIKQLRNMANPSKTTINTTPDAPAAPPAELTGQAVPVKGMLNKNTASKTIVPPSKKVSNSPVAKQPKWAYNAGSKMGG